MLKSLVAGALIICALSVGPIKSLGTHSREDIHKQQSKEMRKYMNESADPCEDFYNFACGNWKTHHPADYNEPHTQALKTYLADFDRKLQQQMEAADEMVTDSERKVKDFFHSCMKFSLNYRDLEDKMTRLANEFGPMPALVGENWKEDEFDWLQTVAEISYKYGKTIIFGPSVEFNERNRTTLGISISSQWFKGRTDFEELYEEYANFLIRLLDLKSEKAKEIAKELVDFEEKLWKASETETKGKETSTIEKLHEKYSPDLNIKRLLNISLGFLPSGEVVDENPSYHHSLREIMKKTPKRVVANYIAFRLLDNVYPFMLLNADTKRCVRQTKAYFSDILSYMLYHTYKLQDKEQIVEKMWQDVKSNFQTILESSALNWLDQPTREKALEKLLAMKMMVPSYNETYLREEYGSLTINRNDYLQNQISLISHANTRFVASLSGSYLRPDYMLSLSSPYYVQAFNTIIVPITSLTSEFFSSPSSPNAFNYGRLGFLVSHELLHGFSAEGRLYDKFGEYQGKRAEGIEHDFEERRKCLYDQYHSYTFGGLPIAQEEEQTENAADNAGIVLAYQAYRRWYEDNTRSTDEIAMETLHLNYTNSELFFINYAQMWCSDTLEAERFKISAYDNHSPDQLRAVVPLINFDEFSLQFRCSKGSPMNPIKKCRIY